MSPLVPIAAVDPVRAVELAGRSGAWLATVLQQRKNRRERGAAQVLRELGVLAIWAHALNNAGRAATTPLLRYSADWSRDEKQRAFDHLDAFLNDASFLPEIERSAAALSEILKRVDAGTTKLDTEVQQELSNLAVLVDRAHSIALKIQHSEGVNTDLGQLWRALEAAEVGNDLEAAARAVDDWGRDARQLVPPDWLSELDAQLGRLRAIIATTYPNMPAAEWLSGTPSDLRSRASSSTDPA